MMKNFLRKVMMFALVSATLTYVGCKDYDDDIDALRNQLNEQIKQQQDALNAAKLDIEKALQAANDAKGEAAAAKQAAAQAKLDAVNEVKTLLNDYATKAWTTSQINTVKTDLGNRIGAIEGVLNVFGADADAQKVYLNAAKIQLDALMAFQTKTGKDVSTVISELQQILNDATGDAESLKARLEAIDAKVGDASVLGGLFSRRITDVVMIPEAYVQGIPTITLNSLAYGPVKLTSTATEEKVGTPGSTVKISNGATAVRYRVNPSGVKMEDIAAVSYVYEKATSRSAVTTKLLDVDTVYIKNNEMVVEVRKADAAKTLTFDAAASTIYTASAKVQLAESALTAEEKKNGQNVYVHSSYANLDESSIQGLKIAVAPFECKNTTHKHYYESYEAAQAANAVKEVVYNKTLDLAAMVTGCYMKDGKAVQLTTAQLNALGIVFEFGIPTKKYELGTNKTNQQEYVAFADDAHTTVESKVPGATGANQNAIGKTPIIRVALKDTKNNNYIDVQWFKIAWTEERIEVPAQSFSFEYNYVLNCNSSVNTFTWKNMVETVLSKIKDENDQIVGMSWEQFTSIYSATPTLTTTDKNTGRALGTLADADATGVEVVYTKDQDNEHTPALVWTLTPAQIGTVLNVRTPYLDASNTPTRNVTITFKNPEGYYGDIKLTLTLKISTGTLPAMHGYVENYWVAGKLGLVAPVKHVLYNPDVDGQYPNVTGEATFKYDLRALFNTAADDQLIVDNVKPTAAQLTGEAKDDAWKCRRYDMQFAPKADGQLTGYVPAFVTTAKVDFAGDNATTGYSLTKATTAGIATATEVAGMEYDPTQTNWFDANYDPNYIYLTLNETNLSESIKLLNPIGTSTKLVAVDVWARVNAYNTIKVHTFQAYFIEPLKITTNEFEDVFTDGVIGGSTVSAADAFTIVDSYGYSVKKTAYTNPTELQKWAPALYQYYKLEEPVWDVTNAVMAMKLQGNDWLIDNTIAYNPDNTDKTKLPKVSTFGAEITTNGTDLTFTPANGWSVSAPVKVYVPVSVTYKFGTVKTYATIMLTPKKTN